MKSLIFLFILVLCTACAPQASTPAVPSPTVIATTKPTSTASPTSTTTPTLLPPSTTPVFETIIDSLVIDQQGQIYAGGYGTVADNVRRVAEWNGTTWIVLENSFQTAGRALAVDSAGHLYADVLTQESTTAIMRWDGDRWEDITGNFTAVIDALQAERISSNIPVAALAVDGEDNLYVAGSFQFPSADHTNEFPMGFVAKWNQETWTVLGQGFDQVNILDMAVSPTGNVYVVGEQPRVPSTELSIAGFVAEWNGETWTQIGTSKLDACFNTTKIALGQTDGLYTSCRLNEGGELIFEWDGTDWMLIADRWQGEAPAIWAMAVDVSGYLYIGGSFDAVSGVPARNIAYWDGSSWHALGDGLNGQVYALAFDPSGELYATGLLIDAAGMPAAHVERWDGDTWHTLEP